MTRKGFAHTFLIAAIACIGCSSSSSTQPPSDMDKMAAALDKPAAPGAAQTPAVGAAQPAAASNSAPAAPSDQSLRIKRGFDVEDWNETAYILVKADVAKTADALAKEWKGKVIKDVLGKPADNEKYQVVVYQLAGHPWSIFACDDGRQLEPTSAALSRDTDVLVAWQSDFNGWTSVQLFRGGQEVEAIHWGSEEDKIGEDADALKWQMAGKIPRKNEDESYNDAILFRSKLRKITPQDLQKGDAFIDDMFRAQDAYLPDSVQMPEADSDSDKFSSPLGAGAFAGVHAVEVTDP